MTVNRKVVFLCDPSAGIGAPVANGTIENLPCQYSFLWRSLYACPVCQIDVDIKYPSSSNMNVTEFTIDFHHRYYYSPCQDGQRTKTFFWAKNPPMCQGVSLPAPVVVNCSETQTVCPAGQFLEILEYHIPFFLFLSFAFLPPVL